MSRPTLEPSDKARLTAIEAQLHDIARGRPVRGGSFRDLSDVFAIPIGHGDLLVYSRTAGGLVKVPVGANGQVLTADSADPNGVQWAAVPTPSEVHPAGTIWRTVAQGIPDGVDVAMVANSSDVQDGVTWDGSTGLTVPTTGWYLLTAAIKWETNSTGQRSLHIGAVGGGEMLADVHVMSGAGISGPGMNAAVIRPLPAGSTWSMSVLQQSGGSLNLLTGASYTPYFAVHWLGA